MTIRKTLITAAIAGLTLAASVAGAHAASAVATGTVNVRSGPGTGYDVVDSLRRGERVEVSNCRGSWCYVEKRGSNGWVASSYLARSGGYDDYYEERPPVRRPPPPPRWRDRYDDGYFNDGPRRPRPSYGYGPPRGYRDNSACFGSPGVQVCVTD